MNEFVTRIKKKEVDEEERKCREKKEGGRQNQ